MLPRAKYPLSRENSDGTMYLLNRPLQKTLSQFICQTRPSLPEFVEMIRDQTPRDYRPNKHMIPAVIEQVCAGYPQLKRLQQIVTEGVRVHIRDSSVRPAVRPTNHGSARERLNVLRKNVRKEQDAWRCLVLDKDILEPWPEIVISPFGVVDMAGGDPASSGRTIHNLAFPEGCSINDHTDSDAIPKPEYSHCDAITKEVLRVTNNHPNDEVVIMAGDVASAFRNSLHSTSVQWFAGIVDEEDALIIGLCAPFGWTGSPGSYEIVGGAISYAHGSHTNDANQSGFFNYHWFAGWSSRQKVLGLNFDSVAQRVSMPESKLAKARGLVASVFHSPTLSRQSYRSLLRSLRHVATCIRSARPFLQQLRNREAHLHRFQSGAVSAEMKAGLKWWWLILHSPRMNGVAMEYFQALPSPDITAETDAFDFGLCALDVTSHSALTYQFNPAEASLVSEFKSSDDNGFDINLRELASCAFAVHAWGARWAVRAKTMSRPLHIHFRINNKSAVTCQTKLASCNPRAQMIIRLLGWWETTYHHRFSASHIPGVGNIRADADSRLSSHVSFANKFASLTHGWSQISPSIAFQGLTMLWLRISELTPLPDPCLPSTSPH
eukprot:jgi/Phyca11/101947/e_gw1.6.759.1